MTRARVLSGASGDAALEEAFAIREAVFVREQGYALDIERDAFDPQAAHALAYEGEKAVGTGRLYLDEDGEWHIGRIAVLKEARGRGIGDLVMRMLLLWALNFGAESVYLGSQEHAIGFYAKLGFEVYGGEYLDEGQPHYHMSIDRAAMERLFSGCAGCGGCGGCGGECPPRN